MDNENAGVISVAFWMVPNPIFQLKVLILILPKLCSTPPT